MTATLRMSVPAVTTWAVAVMNSGKLRKWMRRHTALEIFFLRSEDTSTAMSR